MKFDSHNQNMGHSSDSSLEYGDKSGLVSVWCLSTVDFFKYLTMVFPVYLFTSDGFFLQVH
jgi:hypothetical protein